MTFEKFEEKHQTLAQSFDCGNIVINNFLKNGDALDANQGITYLFREGKVRIGGMLACKQSERARDSQAYCL